MRKKVLSSLFVVAFLSVSGAVYAVTQTDVLTKIQQIFDSSTKAEGDKKLAEINSAITKINNDAAAEVQAEIDKSMRDAAIQIDDYVSIKVDNYKKQMDQIINTQKQQVQTKKQEAVDKQKAEIDKQLSQFESDYYQNLNDRLK